MFEPGTQRHLGWFSDDKSGSVLLDGSARPIMLETHQFATPDTILAAVAPPSAAAALVLITDAARLGQTELAAGLLEASRRRLGPDAGFDLMEVSLRARAGHFAAASQVVQAGQERGPGSLLWTMYQAQLRLQMGERRAAIEQLSEVVTRCPDYPGVAGALATALMPGPGYREVLRMVHQTVAPRGYLEIGVESGATLALSASEVSVGVDPDFSPLNRSILAPNCRLYECTSQEFFARHSGVDVFGRTPVDLAFIDGLHHFDAVVADFAEVERWSHPRTVVVLHDALPIAPVYSERQRTTRFWVGDVWKAVCVLRLARPELRVRIISTPPSGLAVVTGLQPQSGRGPEFYFGAIERVAAISLSSDVPAWPLDFPVVSNDANGYREALGI